MLFGVMRLLSYMPLWLHHLNASVICFVLCDMLHYRRRVIEANLLAAMPELSDRERKDVIRKYYRNMSDLIVEFIWDIGKSGHMLKRKGFVEIEGIDILKRMCSSGHSVMLLNSHSGNWEMYPSVADILESEGVVRKADIRTAYKRLQSDFWEDVTIRARTSGKCDPSQYIDSRVLLRYILSHREDSYMYFFLVDQYPYQTPHPIGDFMGLPTNVIMGAAQLAERFGMPVAYMRNMRVARGKYLLCIEKICDDASVIGAQEIMRVFMSKLEADIRNNPSNWLWSHKRWKNIHGMYDKK